MNRSETLLALRRRLQQGDPAAEPAAASEPSAAVATANLRRRVLAAVQPPALRSPPVFRVPAGAALVLVLFVLVLALVMGRRHSPSPSPRAATAALPQADSEPAAVRQMQFQTRGGTRVVWVVAANLDL